MNLNIFFILREREGEEGSRVGLRRRRWGSEGSVASLVWAAAGALLRRRGGQVAGRDNRTCSKAVLLWMNRKL